MKILMLGVELLIDKIDLDLIRNHKWSLNKGYFRAYVNGKTQFLHHIIAERMGLDLSNDIDHTDGNPLNNQRDNLRSATRSQNKANGKRYKNNKSGFKGVTKCGKRWRATICINYKCTHLGLFDDPEKAARNYDLAALKYFGEFAFLNFSEDDYVRTGLRTTCSPLESK